MPPSVLKNVIHPKSQTAPLESSKDGRPQPALSGLPAFEAERAEHEDMEFGLSALVENAPIAMAMFDRAMRYLLANRQWIQEFGLQQVQPLVGRSQYEIFPGLHPGWRQVYDRALQGHIVRSEHDSLSGPDGRHLIYRWEVRPWRKKRDASVGGLMVTCEKFSTARAPAAEEDATADQESVTQDEREIREKHAEPLDCSLPMLVVDERGVIHSSNLAATNLALDKGIHQGVTCFWEVFGSGRDFSTLRQHVLEVLAQLAKEGGSSPVITAHTDTADEATLPARWLASPLPRKQPTEASPKEFMLLGLPAQVATEAVTRVTFQMPVEAAPAAPAQAVDTAERERIERELARTKQELRTLAEAQHTFGQKEARLRSYLDEVPCGLFVLDAQGSLVFQNERLARLLGRSLAKNQPVEEWLAHGCPTEEHREQVVLAWRESVWRRQLTRTVSLATADGLLKELEFHPAALPGGGLLVSIQDVTEQMRQEEQLLGMEAKLRTFLLGSPVAIVLTDKAGVIFEVNQRAELLLGQPKAELRRYPLDAWLDPESAIARREALRNLHKHGRQAGAIDIQIKSSSGPIQAILHLASVADAQGEAHCTVHYLQQVPAPDAASPQSATPSPAALTSAPRVSKVAVIEPQPLLTTDANGRVRTWSEAAHRILGVEAAAATGRPLHPFFRPSDATGFYADLMQWAAAPDTTIDQTFFGSDGRRGSVKISARGLDDGGFELTVHEAPPADVDEKPLNEQGEPLALDSALTAFQLVPPSAQRWPVVDLERERLLLTETHHRIKNHLQIISSLLNMQINGVSDQDARDALRSSQNRVRAIAALHQHLYQIALGKGGTFGMFAEDLVAHLRQCYEVPAEQVGVRLDIQEGAIQPEWLMPLALTLNEALSNSFEHAFPHGRQGQITATLRYAQASGELFVRDDGLGLDPGFHPGEGTGLGLKILAVFAEQMRGQLFVQGRPDFGTEIHLRFPLASAES